MVVVGAVFPAKGNRVLVDLEHAGVGDGGAGDISAEIFERAGSRTAGLDVHAPVFAPDLRIDLPVIVLEESVEVLAESGLEVRQVQHRPISAAARCVSQDTPRSIGSTPQTDAPYRKLTSSEAAMTNTADIGMTVSRKI